MTSNELHSLFSYSPSSRHSRFQWCGFPPFFFWCFPQKPQALSRGAVLCSSPSAGTLMCSPTQWWKRSCAPSLVQPSGRDSALRDLLAVLWDRMEVMHAEVTRFIESFFFFKGGHFKLDGYRKEIGIWGENLLYQHLLAFGSTYLIQFLI